jgi:hypothetical protein
MKKKLKNQEKEKKIDKEKEKKHMDYHPVSLYVYFMFFISFLLAKVESSLGLATPHCTCN